jgi:hypothetical protein
MKIQNLADTLTADPAAFGEYETFKRDNVPFLIEEYFMTRTPIDEYRLRISVLDEDQNPIVTGVVDIYDDLEEAERQIAFVGALASRFRDWFTDAQLRTMLDCYDLFMAKAQFPVGREDFTDLRMVSYALDYAIHSGKDVEELFAPATHTRKNKRTDWSGHRFRAVATQITNAVVAARTV